MTFASTSFLFAFLPIVLFAYYGMPVKLRNVFLLLISIIFYILAEPNYILILILTVILNYISGIIIEKVCISDLKSKMVFLLFPIILNLGILIYFKDILLLLFKIDQTPITPVPPLVITTTKILIPLGISYYILQSISYLIDIYQNRIIAETNLINFSLYMTMFPKIIAGPITKYKDTKIALDNRVVVIGDVSDGVEYFIVGLFKKVLLSNNISLLWQNIYDLDFNTIPVATAWLGAVAFSFTLYFDMSGYTDMAIGVGKMIGFDLPKNFNYPYVADNVTDFFKRWHISLISWFEDYVYKPLISSDSFIEYKIFKTAVSTVITWTLIGFWHGATAGTVASSHGINFGVNFLLFGIYFGFIICLEMFFKNRVSVKFKIHKIIKHFYTILVVTLGFVLLDPSNIIKTYELIKTMLFLNGNILVSTHTLHLFWSNIVILSLCVLCSTAFFNKADEKYTKNYPKLYPCVKYVIIFVMFFVSLCYLL